MKNSTQVVRTILCLLVLFATGRAHAQSATAPFTHQGITASTGDFLGFLQYKPEDYDLHPNTKYPIIIFLHGIGERGNGTTDLDKVAYVGMPRIIYKGNKMKFTWNGKTETFLVLAPQCPVKYPMWPAAFVNDLINYAKQNLHIDTNRIYLTGLSMGAGGSLRYISDALPGNAKTVAAVATIAAPCTFNTGRYAAEAHLPVWCFHAEDDPIASVQCTKRAIAGLDQWNPSPRPMLDLWATGGHIVWDRVYTDTNYKYQGVVNIYEWFLGQNKSLPVNKLPVANAGEDKSVTGTTIVLDGSASSDEDGKLVRYVWKKLSGPASGILLAPMSENPSTTVKGIAIPGKYTFELAAVDDRAAFTRDTVTITVTSLAATAPVPVPVKDTVATSVKDPVAAPVTDTLKTTPVQNPVVTPVKDTVQSVPTTPVVIPKPATNPPANKAPVANAGIDVVTNIGWPQSLINATLSTDSDGWITNVRWTKVSGPSQYRILDSTMLRTYATNLTAGAYVFRLTVTDNKGASASDDMTITVNPSSANPPPAVTSKTLVANAGIDVVTNIGWPQSLINATPSTDSDGWITKVRWTKVSGPAQYKILDSTMLRTYATNLSAGVYVFRVTVTDNKGVSDSDEMTITVNPSSAVAQKTLVANAGVDVITNLGWPQSLINATPSTDSDGWITKVRWTKVSGPSQYKILDSTMLRTYATNLAAGVYVFRVTVTDNKGVSDSDEMTITVKKDYAEMMAALSGVSSNLMIEETTDADVAEGALSVAPNPAIGSLQLSYSSSVMGATNIVVYDLNGRTVKRIAVTKNQTVLKQTIDVHGFVSGVYYAVAMTGNKSYAPVKFIKQ